MILFDGTILDGIVVFLDSWRPKPKPPQPPPQRTVAVSVQTPGIPGLGVNGAFVTLDDNPTDHTDNTNADGYVAFHNVPEALVQSHLTVEAQGYQTYSVHLDIPSGNQTFIVGDLGRPVGEREIQLPPLTPIAPPAPAYEIRTGIVSRVGNRVVADEQGVFHPLGQTLFWAMQGYKFERDRLFDNLRWLAEKKWQYYRLLGQVDWDGWSIEPSWPDYDALLAGVIDEAYDRFGLRAEISMIGSQPSAAHPYDPANLAHRTRDIVNARPHKVIQLEVANEWNVHGGKIGFQQMVDIARFWKATTPNLVALSGTGDVNDMMTATNAAGLNLYLLHTEREEGDFKWRQVRQGWDFKGSAVPAGHNEPPGPGSSVGENDNPLQLAMMRAVGIISGATFYVLHNAAGVTGRPFDHPTGGHRPANLWEMPNIDAIMSAVKNIETLLPAGCEDWPKFNNHWAGHPLPCHPDEFWGDGQPMRDHGINKNYACSDGGHFVVSLSGVFNWVIQRAARACHVTAYDPITLLPVDDRDLNAGDTWRLEGRSDTMTGYIVHGRYL